MSNLQRETARRTAARNFTRHGLSGHELYEIWRSLFGDSTRRAWVGNEIDDFDDEECRDRWVDPGFWNLTDFVGIMERRLPPRPSWRHNLERVDLDEGWFQWNMHWTVRPLKRKKRARAVEAADRVRERQAEIDAIRARCREQELNFDDELYYEGEWRESRALTDAEALLGHDIEVVVIHPDDYGCECVCDLRAARMCPCDWAAMRSSRLST